MCNRAEPGRIGIDVRIREVDDDQTWIEGRVNELDLLARTHTSVYHVPEYSLQASDCRMRLGVSVAWGLSK